MKIITVFFEWLLRSERKKIQVKEKELQQKETELEATLNTASGHAAKYDALKLKLENETSEAQKKAKEAQIAAAQREHRARIIIDQYKPVLDAQRIKKQIDVCTHKVVYRTEEGAAFASLALYYKDGRLVQGYKCEVCPYFHLTSSRAPTKLVNRELVRKDGYADTQSLVSFGAVARFESDDAKARFHIEEPIDPKEALRAL